MTMDDYLDLYNYASSLGDREWQDDLLEQMKAWNSISESERHSRSMRELWSRFDEINLTLAELYLRLREEEELETNKAWKERIWELKLERIQLAKLIQTEYLRIH